MGEIKREPLLVHLSLSMEPKTCEAADGRNAQGSTGTASPAAGWCDDDFDRRAVFLLIDAVGRLASLVVPDLLWPAVIMMTSIVLSDAAEKLLPWCLFLRLHALLAVLLMLVVSVSATT